MNHIINPIFSIKRSN